MNKFSRREIIGAALGTAGLVSLPGILHADEKIPYIGMTEDGPLYPPQEIPWLNDLTTNGAGGVAQGIKLYLFGSILTRTGRPLKNATVEIWQTDFNGVYLHPRGWDQDNLDPNFAYFAKTKTNEHGFYMFKTIRPRWYYLKGFPDTPLKGIPRAAHVHMKIRHREHGVVTTEAYFDNESHEEISPIDRVFLSRPKHVRDVILLTENKPADFRHLDVDFDKDAICCRYDMAFLL